MWYFSWVIGVSLCCALGILNALWMEVEDKVAEEHLG